jgi:hypothetical protein
VAGVIKSKKKKGKEKVVYTYWSIDHYLREKAQSDLIGSFIKHAPTTLRN